MKHQESQESGIALIATLAILVLATILVVGFASSMRTERQAAASMASNENTELITQAAIDHATTLLYKNIPQPQPPGQPPSANNWSIAPGMLFVGGNSIPLSSGDPALSDPDLNQADTSGNKAIVPGSTKIQAAWVNLFGDPSQAADGTVKLADGSLNQIVGRYAFWMDDENSKINVNTAYGKPAAIADYFPNVDAATSGLNSYIYGVPGYFIPLGSGGGKHVFPDETNPYSLGHPASVSLDTLLFTPSATVSLDRETLFSDRSAYQLGAASQISQYVTGDPNFYQTNKFWLTHVNGDPEFNIFGKSRIFFTDSTFQLGGFSAGITYPGSASFAYVSEPSSTAGAFRDSAEPLTFHVDANVGTAGSDDPVLNSATAAVKQIASYLNSTWPGYSQSFVQKWSTAPPTADDQGKREAQQVAWNLFGLAASASNETTNGIWSNLIRATGATPSLSSYLWDGPKVDASWPTTSRILPQTRSAKITKFGMSFVATQFTKANAKKATYVVDPATGTSIKGTTKYVVNVRIWPQVNLPLGYQGIQQFSGGTPAPWDISSDEIYITHFEATINDQVTSPRTVIWSSETPADNLALYWDKNGRTNLFKFPGYSQTLAPDGKNYGFKASAAGFSATSTAWDFSTVDQNATVTPNRSISFLFDAGSTSKPCLISNVKLRFVVTSGVGSNAAPTQISPIRDIDLAPGYEAPVAGASGDSGAIIFPSFQILTSAKSTNTPEYWVAMETLDPRLNQRGTPKSGITANDDWYSAAPPAPPPTVMPQEAARNTRLTSAFPQVGTAGDESKLSWLDASSYIQKNPSKIQRFRWGMTPGDVYNRFSSIGMLSCISTGIQTGIPWRTIKLQSSTENPPDWLLLDLFAKPTDSVTFTGKYPDSSVPPPLTYMNSTAGKININAIAFLNSTSQTAALRDIPIKALFLNAYRPQVTAATASYVSATTAATLYTNITTYLGNKTSRHFDYIGEICQVPGIADAASGSSEWEREALVRNLASLVTTKSNVFSVWGVAQRIKKRPGNTQYNTVEATDLVVGEKRFHAIIQRYAWPGVDAIGGNGQAPAAGSYSKLGSMAYLASPTNTIDASDPSASSFYGAYNPGAAAMKYRVVYFEYLN